MVGLMRVLLVLNGVAVDEERHLALLIKTTGQGSTERH